MKRVSSLHISDEDRLNMLLDKCEAMSVLCQKATQHWSLIKFCFSNSINNYKFCNVYFKFI